MLKDTLTKDLDELFNKNIENIDEILPHHLKGFYVIMVRELIKNFVSDLNKKPSCPEINLSIYAYKDEDGKIKVEAHEGFYTAYLPAVSTCMVHDADMDEFFGKLKDEITALVSDDDKSDD